MGNLIPGQPIIYERVDNTLYARYRDPPYNKIPRWIVGTSLIENETSPTWSEWVEIYGLAKQHKSLRIQIDKLLDTYYLLKES